MTPLETERINELERVAFEVWPTDRVWAATLRAGAAAIRQIATLPAKARCLRCDEAGFQVIATETWEGEPSCKHCFDTRNDAARERQYADFHGGSSGPSQAEQDGYAKDTGRRR